MVPFSRNYLKAFNSCSELNLTVLQFSGCAVVSSGAGSLKTVYVFIMLM